MGTLTLLKTPKQDGFCMPAEWTPHEQTWLIWPERPDNWREQAQPAQTAFVTLVKSIAEFEPVSLGVSAKSYEHVYSLFENETNVRIIELSSDDAWVRDTGPTFIRNSAGEVRGIDWIFNAWGGLNGGLYDSWALDDQVAQKILQIEKLARYRADFILEGGAIHVDGEGTLLTTETCLLNPNRNPHLSRSDIEDKLREYLGIEKVLWIPKGIVEDETDEHVDNMACFIAPAEVLLAWTDDQQDPQYAASMAAFEYLSQQTDAKGRALKIHKIPVPGPLYMTDEEAAGVMVQAGSQPRQGGNRLAASYVNFLFCNGGIVMPAFDDPMDKIAADLLSKLCPEHKIVQIPGRELLLGGGNIHCLTQQQPIKK
ncbi:agmatine deiminase [Nitrincola nitratireducens]|uniref:Putative agmatine deiminase n=1 Tax=Nitrincola nitratireducens TaxID=1229521 RepID=W9UQ46_9GAMM|nr:agmatine deiminase [Nitrincola nitratireducens]EXJ09239.1 Agmatine deiminase [Nitrincola nitratireducens]